MVGIGDNKAAFPDGPMGGYAFTYANVMETCTSVSGHSAYMNSPETIFLNLVLAIRQINELKGRVSQLEHDLPTSSMKTETEGLTYTGAAFDQVVKDCAEGKIDISLHDVTVLTNWVDHAVIDPSNLDWERADVTEGYRMFLKEDK
jgi:hypothetical protein